MSLWEKVRGTVETVFQIGLGGPLWKNNSGVLEARNSGDSAFVVVRVAEPVGAPDALPNGDFLLDNEPDALNNTYSNTSSGGHVTQEKWVRTVGATNLKTIDYTYNLLGQVTSEVRKVYATDGTTVIAQMTFTYSYTGSSVTGATVTRDI